MRTYSEIKYSRISQVDIRRVIEEYEQYLNRGQYIKSDMLRAFHSKGYVGYKAEDGGQIVGIISGRTGIAFTYPHLELEAELREYVSGRDVYTVDSLLVLPEYRHQGIARHLIDDMRKWLLRAGIKLALAEIWIYPDGTIPAATAFSCLGRTLFQRRISMFYKENRTYQIECPICGKNCCCGAVIKIFLL
ncbi:MAG: GNAT family N-acetyltransferase [Lachnospiraceae bacterium]|nr:GNAT family N-acetyltransferase [Lachnospiraceae bacterium]